MPKSSRPILVAGGAGFIGHHLCSQLVRSGLSVICVDNFHTGSFENIAHLEREVGFTWTKQDVTDPLDFEVSEIINLACPASPVHYQTDPVRTLKTNVLGAINLIELAERESCQILHASTSEVYGDPEVHPQTEDYWGYVNPIGPRSCYDEGKRCAETLLFDHAREYDLPIKVARIFNTFGPNMHPNDGRVVSNFIMQALRGEDLTVYGKGEQTRSFCYVDDMIDGLMALRNAPREMQGPYNLGNPQEKTVLELAEWVISRIGGTSKITFKPLPTDDPQKRKPAIEKAKADLNWEPKVSIEDGLDRTISYFRSRFFE